MCEDLESLAGPGQLHHAEGSFDVAVDGLVQPGVEVDAGGAVHDYLAVLHNFGVVLGAEAQTLSVEVAHSAFTGLCTWGALWHR